MAKLLHLRLYYNNFGDFEVRFSTNTETLKELDKRFNANFHKLVFIDPPPILVNVGDKVSFCLECTENCPTECKIVEHDGFECEVGEQVFSGTDCIHKELRLKPAPQKVEGGFIGCKFMLQRNGVSVKPLEKRIPWPLERDPVTPTPRQVTPSIMNVSAQILACGPVTSNMNDSNIAVTANAAPTNTGSSLNDQPTPAPLDPSTKSGPNVTDSFPNSGAFGERAYWTASQGPMIAKPDTIQLPKFIYLFRKERLSASKDSRVFKGEQWTAKGKINIAIKLLEYNPHSLGEARVLLKLQSHERVVGLLDFGTCEFDFGKFTYLAMEMCCDQTLYDYVENNPRVEPDRAVEIAKQILEGLVHIHENGIMHRDLKPHNVLFSITGSWEVKLADFGLSKETRNGKSIASLSVPRIGANGFRAPETYNCDEISQRADVFSAGLTFFFTWSGGCHAYGDDPDEWNSNIKKGKNRCFDKLQLPDKENAIDLLESMLQYCPKDRPTSEKALSHPLFYGGVSSQGELEMKTEDRGEGGNSVPNLEKGSQAGNNNTTNPSMAKEPKDNPAEPLPDLEPETGKSSTASAAPPVKEKVFDVGYVFEDPAMRQSSKAFYEDHLGKPFIYQVPQSRRKGTALIINNSFRSVGMEREGSEADVKNMASLWRELGLAVELHGDLTAVDLMSCLRSFSQKLQDVSLCVVVIMTHGTSDAGIDMVYGEDKKAVPTDEVLQYFTAPNCPQLKGIPKFVIFQSCRGTKLDAGVTYPHRAKSGTKSVNTRTQVDGIPCMEEASERRTLPSMSDMLVAHSTVSQHVAYRSMAGGSWFISAISEIFRKHCRDTHVLDMLMYVNSNMANKRAHFRGVSEGKQISEYRSTLRKHLYLFPGFPDKD